MARKNKGINIFRHVPEANNPSTEFNMSHEVKFDGDFGRAYPILCQEILAGDTVNAAADHFSRLAPMIAPVYHDYDVRFHWFYVPMRLLWDDFEDWMTGGRTGTWREDNPDSFPLFQLNTFASKMSDLRGSLLDFLGVNTAFDGQNADEDIIDDAKLPIMPLRGYALIYNYFFRDQNVTDEIDIPLTSGLNSISFLSRFENKGLFKVAWDKDYFTSATLTPQRGPQVYIPLGQNAPIVSNPNFLGYPIEGNTVIGYSGSGDTMDVIPLGTLPNYGKITADGQEVRLASTINPNSLEADLSSTEGAAVNDVRESFALQRFFERMQIIGSRFSEWLRGIWGTNAGDARLQMPEYLGTWTNPFMINNVSNTTGTENNPQGGYAGNGMATNYNPPIVKYFNEPGYLYCLYIAMPKNGYQQGLAPIFCRKDWLDFANPYFEHIGEQPISMKEIYYNPNLSEAYNDSVFGYQSQYANYKFINSHSHGTFKSTLNFWHSNRIFQTAPTLSNEFIEFDKEESTDRAFVLPNESKFYTVVHFKMSITRQLSAFSTPRLV